MAVLWKKVSRKEEEVKCRRKFWIIYSCIMEENIQKRRVCQVQMKILDIFVDVIRKKIPKKEPVGK